MLNRHFSPASYEEPDAVLVAAYAAEWAAQSDAEIAVAVADTYSALAEWGDDEATNACHAALFAEAARRGGLRGEIAAIHERRG